MRYSMMGLACTLMLSGCATLSQAEDSVATIDRAPFVRSITLCKTTLAEVQKTMGEPSRDGLLQNQRVLSWITEWDPLVRYLAVLVDDQKVVVDLYWNMPSEVVWAPTNQCRKD